MSAANFTRIEIYICRNKSLSNRAQIYDVTYMPRVKLLFGWVYRQYRQEGVREALSEQDTISSRYQAKINKNA
jgi:hypothetical protein